MAVQDAASDSPLPVVLPVRGTMIFPGMLRVLVIGRESSIKAIDQHVDQGRILFVAFQLDADEEDPFHARLARFGVQGEVLRVSRLPDGSLRILLEGVARVALRGKIGADEGAVVSAGQVLDLEPTGGDPVAVGSRAQELFSLYEEYTSQGGMPPHDHELLTATPDDPGRLADQVAGVLDLSLEDSLQILGELDLQRRLDLVLLHLATALARQRIAADVNGRVQAAMDQGQREYHLKEQLKAIRAELGEGGGPDADADQFEKRLHDAEMPEEVRDEALREVDRLRRVHVDSAEYTILRTWLETVCDLPWSHATPDNVSLGKAQKVLDRDHYGLDKVKERILEYLAVRQLQPASKGPILCFVGPPGVGKTSLGRSIAAALGRNFGRIALGGIKDETEIRGHRRTYVGALPGRIVRALTRAGSKNPVLVLDELDKVGADFRGDPASALLEVLDPEQNGAFMDHYLDLPIDLSQVLFIATANVMDPIPPALFDRLEIIEIPGYTEEEKVVISRRFLLPKLTADHGLKEHPVRVETRALQQVVRDYTREAGLRELERQLATLHRKVARRVVEGHAKTVRISERNLPRYLGPPKYFQELAERVDQPGVVIGLAWTASGGDILFIEAIRMPGKMSLKLTGSLGDVMKESVEAAMSWLRSHASALGVPSNAFEAEFHLHVPAGAIPKDGPSAGVTMVTALASVVTRRPVKARLAMTGEITLRGKVLPVGGVREKALAARRAGVQTLLLPTRNQTDLEDIPAELRKDLTFHFVDNIEQVLELALEPAALSEAAAAR